MLHIFGRRLALPLRRSLPLPLLARRACSSRRRRGHGCMAVASPPHRELGRGAKLCECDLAVAVRVGARAERGSLGLTEFDSLQNVAG